jgi:hypothetical protein
VARCSSIKKAAKMDARIGRIFLPVVLLGSIVASGAGAADAATTGATKTLWVAPTKVVKGESAACRTANFHQINPAIKAASNGDTVMVCAGTYSGSTTIKTGAPQQPTITTGAAISKSIRLIGEPGADINATNLDNGVTFFIASNATVQGLSVTGALGEGILALLSSHVTIANNVVEHNDNGGNKSGWTECEGQGNVPGDCGEGIHLLSSTWSKILDNTSEFNSGGVLLDDDFGPNDHNAVEANLVEDNESDCGITVVGHNASAVNSSGVPTPTKGGTFDNTIHNNVVISNGTTGFGGGILFASGVQGGGSYDNTATGNEIAGNGISGITIHQHAPLSDVSGDTFSGNTIGTNDILGDPGTGDSSTTGVLVDNGGTGKAITVAVTNNTIARDVYGIYDDAPGLTAMGNKFVHVKVDIKK